MTEISYPGRQTRGGAGIIILRVGGRSAAITSPSAPTSINKARVAIRLSAEDGGTLAIGRTRSFGGEDAIKPLASGTARGIPSSVQKLSRWSRFRFLAMKSYREPLHAVPSLRKIRALWLCVLP